MEGTTPTTAARHRIEAPVRRVASRKLRRRTEYGSEDRSVTTVPETSYARSGSVNIAYQVIGDGPRDLMYVAHEGLVLEMMWEQPALVRALRRLASFSRLILFDHRGTGVSDPLPPQRLTL